MPSDPQENNASKSIALVEPQGENAQHPRSENTLWRDRSTYYIVSRPQGAKRTALQRHCDFWDADHDGLIYSWDIYIGFRKLGFSIALCIWAAISMAICLSYGTQTSWLPHPLFVINLDNIHRSRHGSTTATYDLNHEIEVCRFDSIFEKYAEGKDYLTVETLYNVWTGQRCALDLFGSFASGLECRSLVFLSPQQGDLTD